MSSSDGWTRNCAEDRVGFGTAFMVGVGCYLAAPTVSSRDGRPGAAPIGMCIYVFIYRCTYLSSR